jgi:single-stranded-DNA-specific exonuclease
MPDSLITPISSSKRWQLVQTAAVAEELLQFPPLVQQLLAQRGVADLPTAEIFFRPDYQRDLHDVFLFRDAAKAVDRILSAIAKQERIVVYGDYDADGVSSSAVLMETLTALGSQPGIYIPYRETEGYGMNLPAVTKLADEGAQLIITVDCGVANAAEIAYLQDRGVDVIVTDHHKEPLELPNAFAILNPSLPAETYPFRSLCGVGVAFKLAQGLIARHGQYAVQAIPEGFEKWLLDLVAIGTVADMMPLVGENRALVHYGLRVLQKTRRLGLQKILAGMSGRSGTIDERTIGFFIAPRLNAAGRLGHANTAFELLVTKDEKQAEDLATELDAANTERQRLTEQITQLALQSIGEVTDQPLLAARGVGWPTGLVGLIAGRIADRFYRPTLVMSDFRGQTIGSGRSITEFDITAGLQQCDQYLSRYGGHAQACGFTVKDDESVNPFIEKITSLAKEKLVGVSFTPTIDVDAEVSLADINWKAFELLEQFRPFGEKNRKPKFAVRGVSVTEAQLMGETAKHLRLKIQQADSGVKKLIAFSVPESWKQVQAGDMIDAVVELDVNEWNGNRELQLKIVDLQASAQK